MKTPLEFVAPRWRHRAEVDEPWPSRQIGNMGMPLYGASRRRILDESQNLGKFSALLTRMNSPWR